MNVTATVELPRMKAKLVAQTAPPGECCNFPIEELTRSKPVSLPPSHCDTFSLAQMERTNQPRRHQLPLEGFWLMRGTALLNFWPCISEFIAGAVFGIFRTPNLRARVVAGARCPTTMGHASLSQPCCVYSDNNAARSALVRADEATLAARGIVTEFVKFEKPLHWLTWFGRVPSHSNPADVASRLAFLVPWLFQAKQSRWSCSRT